MRVSVDEHVPELSGLLSLVSLALVFGAALGVLPVGALPRSEPLLAAIPHVNAVVSAVAVVVIGAGWYWARAGRIVRHRRAMVAGFLLFGTFLALYLYRVALEGPTEFVGPEAVYRLLYLPLLSVHVLLAVVCVPLLFYVLLLGLTRPVAELPATAHPRVGRVTAALWLTSFVLGTVVYLLLYRVY